ncbi:MAG: thioredoxin family protein [Candidatus Gastranaerophilales bacterium]|nr:thioredoxin family protein [Candidatus Gastranaerophilales bacterium]
MKSGLKDIFRKNIIVLSGVIFTVSILFALVAFALGRYTLVLFYADWNLNCREAKPMIESISGTYNNVKLVEINIDQPNAPGQARSLGLYLPRAIPQIYVLDNNNKIVTEFTYSGETQKQLKSRLDTAVLR